MKGEWVNGLLPQTGVRADYTIQRIRELAGGTWLKNYEYLGSGEVYDKKNKKWTLELPTNSQLLLYLLCAFLEHPKWMLRVDPTSYVGFPEKYVRCCSFWCTFCSSPKSIYTGAWKTKSPNFCLVLG